MIFFKFLIVALTLMSASLAYPLNSKKASQEPALNFLKSLNQLLKLSSEIDRIVNIYEGREASIRFAQAETLLLQYIYDVESTCKISRINPISFDDSTVKFTAKDIEKKAKTKPTQLPQGKETESDGMIHIRSAYSTLQKRIKSEILKALARCMPSEAEVAEAKRKEVN